MHALPGTAGSNRWHALPSPTPDVWCCVLVFFLHIANPLDQFRIYWCESSKQWLVFPSVLPGRWLSAARLWAIFVLPNDMCCYYNWQRYTTTLRPRRRVIYASSHLVCVCVCVCVCARKNEYNPGASFDRCSVLPDFRTKSFRLTWLTWMKSASNIFVVCPLHSLALNWL